VFGATRDSEVPNPQASEGTKLVLLAYRTRRMLWKSQQCPTLQSHVHAHSRVNARNLPHSYAIMSIRARITLKHVAYHVNEHGRDTLRIWKIREDPTALDNQDIEQDMFRSKRSFALPQRDRDSFECASVEDATSI
jgi:hypothetical protein